MTFIFSAVEIAQSSGQHILRPGEFTLKAPIYNPQKLICIGMNYVDHCTEQNIPVPEEPIIFSKFNSAITEPNGAVVLTDETQVSMPCFFSVLLHRLCVCGGGGGEQWIDLIGTAEK